MNSTRVLGNRPFSLTRSIVGSNKEEDAEFRCQKWGGARKSAKKKTTRETDCDGSFSFFPDPPSFPKLYKQSILEAQPRGEVLSVVCVYADRGTLRTGCQADNVSVPLRFCHLYFGEKESSTVFLGKETSAVGGDGIFGTKELFSVR